MNIMKLFLSFFNFVLFIFINKKRLFRVLYMQTLTIQGLTRVLTKHNLRASFQPHEKHLIASLFEHTTHARKYFSLVSAKTILTKWKHCIARHWTYPHSRPGRKPLAKEIIDLIKHMKQDNHFWGARRISNELKKLSIDVSHTTINKLITTFYKDGTLKPTQAWNTFLKSHWHSLFACDFFTVDTLGYKRFYVFFIIELATRRIVQCCHTEHPNKYFLHNQLSYFTRQYPNARLIHDNSGELRNFPYASYSITGVATVPYAPNMNAYAERFVRTIRRECLDHFIIFTKTQLRSILNRYIHYYNNQRPHMGINGQIPISQAPPSLTGTIRKTPVLGGLHNHYYRKTA